MSVYHLPLTIGAGVETQGEIEHLRALLGDPDTVIEPTITVRTGHPAIISVIEHLLATQEDVSVEPTPEPAKKTRRPRTAKADRPAIEPGLSDQPVAKFNWILPHGNTSRGIEKALKTTLRVGDRVRHIEKGEFEVVLSNQGNKTIRPVSQVQP